MLLGKELSRSEWYVSYPNLVSTLTFAVASNMFQTIPVKKMLKRLNYDGVLFYYVFELNNVPRFVLCSKEAINFASIDCYENMDGEEREIALVTEAALYDLKKEQIVHFSNSDLDFYDFIIYDTGIPNCILNGDTGEYEFFGMVPNGRKYEFVVSKSMEDPKFISYVYETINGGSRINRAIFYRDVDETSVLYTFKKEIIIEESIDDVEFESIESIRSDKVRMEGYATKVFNTNYGFSDTKIMNDYGYFVNKHIYGSDIVIVGDYLGTYGDKVILSLKNGIVYDRDYSMIRFERMKKRNGHYLRLLAWKNDFENEVIYYDCERNKLLRELV